MSGVELGRNCERLCIGYGQFKYSYYSKMSCGSVYICDIFVESLAEELRLLVPNASVNCL